MKTTVNGYDIKSFHFPDGQPHVSLQGIGNKLKDEATIVCSITSPDKLMEVLLTADVLRLWGLDITLKIAYLMGGRMDREIDGVQPFTLRLITDMIKQNKSIRNIELFNAHSEVSVSLLKAKNILPENQVKHILGYCNDEPLIIAPDAGSVKWISQFLSPDAFTACRKDRDSQTGQLSGFTVLEPERIKGQECLIVDDICDGGGTFVGIAKELRKAGAKFIGLYVSHGIFSKGFHLDGIDDIWTTSSYREQDYYPPHVHVLKPF